MTTYDKFADEMTLREFTAHIRGRIKFAGIKARVKGQVICGSETVYVSTPAPGVEFTEDEQRTIRAIAVVNRCTWTHGLPIDVDQMTNPHDMRFHR